MRAIILSLPPTSSLRRLYCSNCVHIKSRLTVTYTSSINKERAEQRNTSIIRTESLGNQCVQQMKANRRVKNGASEQSGRIHFPKSGIFGSPLKILLPVYL